MGGDGTARICEKGGSGLFLPLFGDGEADLPTALRVVVYGLFMVYFFYAASMISDYFMSAIETITGKKKIKRTEDGIHVVDIWNSTVANLSLMALGSSAPEIMLSVVETVALNKFYSGDLGPSTIVGSAAFNFFIIIAVCVISIPSGETRRIKELDVYNITQVFSFLAYTWLLLIVKVWTPSVVTLVEALITVLIFPILLVLSYLADRGYFRRGDEPHMKITRPRVQKVAKKTEKVQNHAGDNHENKVKRKRESQTLLDDGGGAGGGTGSTRRSQFVGGQTMDPQASMVKAYDMHGDLLNYAHGVIMFDKDVLEVDACDEEIDIQIAVYRASGTKGRVACKYHLKSITALPGYDYHCTTGELEFEEGESQQSVTVSLFASEGGDGDEMFQLILEDAEGGAIFSPCQDGGIYSDVLTVIIKNEITTKTGNLCMKSSIREFGKEMWIEQIREAFQVTGGDDEMVPGPLDYVAHVITFPWKVFYATLCPPPIFCGGWLLFCVALLHIAVATTVICDLASMFGCVLGLEDAVTAIIVVAPGTSLPDLFASKSAACSDPTADASIVNVTGSNSVNVFLGIGIPWAAAAFYWLVNGADEEWKAKYPEMLNDYPDGAFVVKSEGLPFSVTVFCSVALMGTGLLRVRRSLFKGELGGVASAKYGSGLLMVFFWSLYIVSSIWSAHADNDARTAVSLIFVVMAGAFIVACTAIELVKNGVTSSSSSVEGEQDSSGQKSVENLEDQGGSGKTLVEVGTTDEALGRSADERPKSEDLTETMEGSGNAPNEDEASPKQAAISPSVESDVSTKCSSDSQPMVIGKKEDAGTQVAKKSSKASSTTKKKKPPSEESIEIAKKASKKSVGKAK